MSKTTISTACPCGSPAFETCCAPYLQGLNAPNAEALMRSRYTAYTQKNAVYLLATWHASTRPTETLFEKEEKLQWLGLEVKSDLRLRKRQSNPVQSIKPDQLVVEMQEAGDKRLWATVEFVARYKLNGRAHRLHEISRFVCEEEASGPRWYYVDGSFP